MGITETTANSPVEAIEVFVPELLSEHGRPATAAVLQQESALPDLAEPSRFLDVALMATWADGSQAVILLIEHWSQARKVDLRRVNWYVADLALRHPLAAVYPVVLVTDHGTQDVPDRWEMTVAGVTTLALRVRVFRVTAVDLPRLRSLQIRVAAVLTALAVMDAVDAVVAAMEHMARSPGPLDDMERFLPFTMKLAKMPESDRPRFRRRLEELDMENEMTAILAAARAAVDARFEARDKARVEAACTEARTEARTQTSRAMVTSIRRLMDRGILTRETARIELQDMVDTGAITRDIGQEALSQLA